MPSRVPATIRDRLTFYHSMPGDNNPQLLTEVKVTSNTQNERDRTATGLHVIVDDKDDQQILYGVTAMVWFLVPETPAGARGQRFDFVGALGLGGGVVCLLLGVSKGADWGWGSATTLGLFVEESVTLNDRLFLTAALRTVCSPAVVTTEDTRVVTEVG